jgi:hypothetical protein
MHNVAHTPKDVALITGTSKALRIPVAMVAAAPGAAPVDAKAITLAKTLRTVETALEILSLGIVTSISGMFALKTTVPFTPWASIPGESVT